MDKLASLHKGGMSSNFLEYKTRVKTILSKVDVGHTQVLHEWGVFTRLQAKMRCPEFLHDMVQRIQFRTNREKGCVDLGIASDYNIRRGGKNATDIAYLVHEFWDELINPNAVGRNGFGNATQRASTKSARTGVRVGERFTTRAVTENLQAIKEIAITVLTNSLK